MNRYGATILTDKSITTHESVNAKDISAAIILFYHNLPSGYTLLYVEKVSNNLQENEVISVYKRKP